MKGEKSRGRAVMYTERVFMNVVTLHLASVCGWGSLEKDYTPIRFRPNQSAPIKRVCQNQSYRIPEPSL